jgi:hypothetical protein
MLIARRPVYYLCLTGTPRRIVLLDKVTNKATITDLILVDGSTIILIVDITELRL